MVDQQDLGRLMHGSDGVGMLPCHPLDDGDSKSCVSAGPALMQDFMDEFGPNAGVPQFVRLGIAEPDDHVAPPVVKVDGLLPRPQHEAILPHPMVDGSSTERTAGCLQPHVANGFTCQQDA